MNNVTVEVDTAQAQVQAQAQAVSDLYRTAAQQLLLAYQRNKEATRHHDRGAFRAALHHARLSCVHAAAANDCLTQALVQSGPLSAPGLAAGHVVLGPEVYRDH